MGFSSTEYENRYGYRRRSSKPGAAGGNSFSVSVDVSALESVIDGIEDGVAEAIRPAAQAGAEVLYSAVLRNVSALGAVTGKLEHSIYQAFSKHHSGDGVASYEVSWNPRKAPHAHLVENGYIKKYKVVLNKKTGKWITLKNEPLPTPIHVPGKGFVRRAQDQFGAAYEAMQAEFLRRINE